MSGGTDSSVAAILLQEAGYEVTGVTFRFYEKGDNTEYLDDARQLCDSLHIPHITYDARQIFKEQIINYFIDEYMAGHTPVPCTLCNNYLKWPLLQQLADEKGIYWFATGHYVQKRMINGLWHITCGADPDKDQSFFLWGLKQPTIERMLLPLGTMTKSEIRNIAAKRGFQKVATKRDSLGVCFCPMEYRNFLKEHITQGSIVPGDFYDEAGQCIGRHEGYPFYTIGQRRGLGIYQNKALFVKQIIPEENKVVISDNIKSLEQNEMLLSDWNIVCPEEVYGQHDDLIVKIRYRKQANRCEVTPTTDGRLHIHLLEPLTSIAIGQAAALYRGDTVMGGGIITASSI